MEAEQDGALGGTAHLTPDPVLHQLTMLGFVFFLESPTIPLALPKGSLLSSMGDPKAPANHLFEPPVTSLSLEGPRTSHGHHQPCVDDGSAQPPPGTLDIRSGPVPLVFARDLLFLPAWQPSGSC